MDKKTQEKLYKLLGDNVKKQRNRLRLTQEQLAVKIDLTRTSVINIEQGKQHVTLHLLLTLAEIFGVNLETLIPKKAEYLLIKEADEIIFKDIKDADKSKFDEFYKGFLNDQ